MDSPRSSNEVQLKAEVAARELRTAFDRAGIFIPTSTDAVLHPRFVKIGPVPWEIAEQLSDWINMHILLDCTERTHLD